jgi:hypothetical protein
MPSNCSIAELGGQILDNKREARRLAQCMKHVEAV